MCFSQHTLGIPVRSLASDLFLIRSIPHNLFYWTLNFRYLEKIMFIFNSKEEGLILERTERQTGSPVPSNNEKVTNKV